MPDTGAHENKNIIEKNSAIKAAPAKILHIVSSSVIGGAEKCFLEMLSIARALNYETAAVCSGGFLEKETRAICNNVYTVPMIDNADFYSLYRLYRIIKEFKADLCHLHMNRATLLGAIAARIAGVVSLGTIQGEVKPIYGYFPDYLTFCSENTANFLRTRSRAAAQKSSFFLYNCVDCGALETDSLNGGRFYLRQEFNVPEDAFIVCQIARMHKNKGHKFLIDAAARIINKIKNLYCVFIGGGDDNYMKLLRGQAEKMNISNRVIFGGVRTDVAKILSSVDLFVLPSLQEGIPITIMEALALGVPAVAFNVGGIYEISGGRAGERFVELITPGNTQALSDKIFEIYGDYSTYKNNAAKARLYIRKNYDKPHYINDIKALYNYILKRSRFQHQNDI